MPWLKNEPSSNLTFLALGSTTNNIEIYYDASDDHIKAWVGGTIGKSIDLTPTALTLARDSTIVVDLTWRSAASAPPNGIIKGAAYVQGTPAPAFVPPGSYTLPTASGRIHVGGHSTTYPAREAAATFRNVTIAEDVIP